MRIKINKFPGSETLTLEVKPYYTAFTIKKKIEYLYGFLCDGNTLTYESVRFKDDNVLSDFAVEDGDTMSLINLKDSTPESFSIFYYTISSGEIDSIYVQPSFTIEQLKLMIFGKTRTSPERMRITILGRYLQDKLIVSDYNIGERSTVHLAVTVLVS